MGIGTSSPLSILHIGSGADANVPITLAPASGGNAEFRSTTSTGSFTFTNDNGASEKMRIDASGNVGIGTSSPAYKLDVASPVIQFGDSTDAFAQYKSSAGNWHVGANSSNAFAFYSGTYGSGSERMRIDSSGNLLVGKTSANYTIAGAQMESNGVIGATVNNNQPMFANRLSSDGSIFGFYKDGTAVGSIGSYVGTHLKIGSGTANVLFVNDTGILPSTSSGAASDGLIDLGGSDRRFKDLYLSGGVYLGGTGAANKLDDYEEGTWTPTITGATSGSATLTVNQASYTKVGRAVHVSCYIINADVTGLVGTITVGGLPFTANGFAMTKSGYCTLFSFDQQTIEVAGYTESGQAYIRLQKGSSITGITGTDATAAGDGRIMMNFTYQTT